MCPIYAALAWEEQRRVFEPSPSGARKLILATNIAETSITIPNVKCVSPTCCCVVHIVLSRVLRCALRRLCLMAVF